MRASSRARRMGPSPAEGPSGSGRRRRPDPESRDPRAGPAPTADQPGATDETVAADAAEEVSRAFLEGLKAEPLGELTVLDAGTGSGRLALALAPLCRAVVGVDRDAKLIDEARRRAAAANRSNVRFVVG